jgi:hypothetical protein
VKARTRGMMFLKRRHTPIGPPTARPLAAVILAIDAARTSGLAWYVGGALAAYSEVDAHDEDARTAALLELQAMARVRGLPHGACIEVPYGGRINAVLSLTATCSMWRQSWARGQPAGHMLERTAREWRPLMFGSGLRREQARRLEGIAAEQIVARDGLPARRIGPDAAAAICLGQTMIRSAEMQTALGCALR